MNFAPLRRIPRLSRLIVMEMADYLEWDSGDDDGDSGPTIPQVIALIKLGIAPQRSRWFSRATASSMIGRLRREQIEHRDRVRAERRQNIHYHARAALPPAGGGKNV